MEVSVVSKEFLQSQSRTQDIDAHSEELVSDGIWMREGLEEGGQVDNVPY